ncbi:hypothetical protein Kpol_1005p2 [Vanderwaltozyma polyspora DSM 70294]|uniref:Zn(2)-C6 fungal-type domain-containing protein n=1 Tax=Vanderwaltozyma polyspora (strain ATCC 22028 / DSM 70294 / BCRC 21397 / CBS 2163 / NBRC 10782 / NRRL Y-8283 / UCD 57-17) TaxID=436907 RepID=A7TS29_VANPO|nr:uncharacterized protein Kpol_1005p2 [Vanderwaltozyma polyspora DSM 70294]EDO14915.1 hypothetical protein Kpol_1005p2 [Vanderwaltozyma polyspora DSM 70294]
MDIKGRKMKKPPACVQCRRRKIGCDRIKPICGNCMKSGKGDCFFPDIPGQYVTSNIGSKDFDNLGSSNGNLMNLPLQHTISHRSRDTAQLLQHNPELASMEQIREYNTRLQLMNAQERRSTPISMESAKFIPRTATKFENKPVTSANSSNLNLNWVQGPAIFELINTQYSEKDLIQRELKFIKVRLSELQEITGKKIEVDLSADEKDKRKSDATEDIPVQKKIRLSSKSDGASAADDINEFDTEILDPKLEFSIFNYNDNDTTTAQQNSNILSSAKFSDVPNYLFDIRFLVKRDKFLEHYYKKLDMVISEKFIDNLTQWNQSNSNKNLVLKSQQVIKFPSRVFSKDVMDHFSKTMKKTDFNITPLENFDDIYELIDKLFGREPEFNPNSLNITSLTLLGKLSVILLLVHSSLSNSVSKPMGEQASSMLLQLNEWYSNLKCNLFLIKNALVLKYGSPQSLEALSFFSLYKYQQSIATDINEFIDGDDDIHIARNLSINYETEDKSLVLLWNFIFRSYAWRHLYKGEIPALIMGNEFRTSIIKDRVLADGIELLSSEKDLVNYLHKKNDILSLKKVESLKEKVMSSFSDLTQKQKFHSIFLGFILQSFIYRNFNVIFGFLFINAYEQLKEADIYASSYLQFLELVKESLLFITNSFSDVSISGLEFLFAKMGFSLIDNICNFLLSLYQRCFFSFSLQSTNNDAIHEMTKQNISEQLKTIITILKKVRKLLQDRVNDSKIVNPLLGRSLVRLTTMIEYIKLCDQESEAQIAINKHLQFGGSSAFDNMKEANLVKGLKILEDMSVSLIKKDSFDEENSYRTVSPNTLGITHENFVRIYTSHFN